MGSAGLSHAPSPQPSPEFVYDRPNNDNSGIPFSTRTIPGVGVPISVPASPEVPAVSTLEQDALLETQDKSQNKVTVPAYHRGSKYERVPYWQNIRRWNNVDEKNFFSHTWNVS